MTAYLEDSGVWVESLKQFPEEMGLSGQSSYTETLFAGRIRISPTRLETDNYDGCALQNSHPPEIGISADVSIFETGFGRFGTVFVYALFGLNLGNPV